MNEFNITHTQDGNISIFRLSGYYNDIAGQDLKDKCMEVLENGTILFVFNMKDTPVINSTGLSTFLDIIVDVIDYHDGSVAVTGLSQLTRNALRMTGVLALATEFPTEAEAISALK